MGTGVQVCVGRTAVVSSVFTTCRVARGDSYKADAEAAPDQSHEQLWRAGTRASASSGSLGLPSAARLEGPEGGARVILRPCGKASGLSPATAGGFLGVICWRPRSLGSQLLTKQL